MVYMENVTVTLQWTPEESVMYHFTITTIPPVPVTFNEDNDAQLTLSYNTLYKINVSVSSTFCGQTSTNFTHLQ